MTGRKYYFSSQQNLPPFQFRGREISTTDDSYVRWTQWIFLQLFKRGLAYQSNIHVNWCPMLGPKTLLEITYNNIST